MNEERFKFSEEIYFGFTPEFIILKILANSRMSSVAIDEIAHQSSLSKKKIYNELKKLEEKAYIKILTSREDKRMIKVAITSRGNEKVKKLQEEFYRM